MKKLSNSWKAIPLIALAGIVSLCYVVRLRAFTLIETQYLPAVQLVPLQTATLAVTNISGQAVSASVSIVAGNGTVLASKSPSIQAGHTFLLPYITPAGTTPTTIRAMVNLGTAKATVSSLMTFDLTTGEVIAVVPGQLVQ